MTFFFWPHVFFKVPNKPETKTEKKSQQNLHTKILLILNLPNPRVIPQRPTHRTIGTFTCSQKILQHRCWFLCIKTSAQPGKLHQPESRESGVGWLGPTAPPKNKTENEMCSRNFWGRFVYSTIFEDLLDGFCKSVLEASFFRLCNRSREVFPEKGLNRRD